MESTLTTSAVVWGFHFVSAFHSHKGIIWSIEAPSSRQDKPRPHLLHHLYYPQLSLLTFLPRTRSEKSFKNLSRSIPLPLILNQPWRNKHCSGWSAAYVSTNSSSTASPPEIFSSSPCLTQGVHRNWPLGRKSNSTCLWNSFLVSSNLLTMLLRSAVSEAAGTEKATWSTAHFFLSVKKHGWSWAMVGSAHKMRILLYWNFLWALASRCRL